MDTLLHSPSLPKRACCEANLSPSESSRASEPEQMDLLLETFLGFSNSSSESLDLSFERLLRSRACQFDQNRMIESALRLGSMLLEAGKRSERKLATKHNSVTWALPPDLTIKVFSLIDTQSLCYAATTCSLFNKCAMDPLCYTNIDLTSVVPKVNNTVVSTMIQRAGKGLRSLKLGVLQTATSSPESSQPAGFNIKNSVDSYGFSWNDKRSRQGKQSSFLSRTCLTSLIGDGGAAGSLLRSLHLYNIDRMDNTSLCMALSACPSLLDLEIVGLHVELRQTLESVSTNCHSIERLFFESSKTGRDESLKPPTCVDLVNGCPHISSLALRGFKLHDYRLRTLVKGFCKLKFLDFSTSYSVTGSFLRNLGSGTNGRLLEVLILRDCMHLKEGELARFFAAILAGDFKLLRYLDISNREGLASEGDWYDRCYSPRVIPIRQVAEERPDICLIAEFPSEGSFIEIEQITDSDSNSDISLQAHLPENLSFTTSSESSYNSDLGSGNEDGREGGRVIYEESSDEADFLAL